MKKILTALLLSLILVTPASAAKPTAYTISLSNISGIEATFSVTRNTNFDNTPVVWVDVSCDIPVPLNQVSTHPVIWGNTTNITGYSTVNITLNNICTAWVTETPWHIKKNDPSKTFNT